MLTSRKAADLETSAGHLTARGIDAKWITADAADANAADRVCSETIKQLGPVDILVNNAGAAWGAPAETHALDGWDKLMTLNVRSVFTFSRAIGRECMIPRRHGRIINVASIAGLGGNPAGHETIAYNTSKGAVINFTRALAAEWGEHGITVNAIAPGWFPSRMTRGTIDSYGAEKLAAAAPLRRIGDDDDLKGAAVLFASAAGKHITGQILAIDGGVSAVITQ
jgi:gluconate 5-dehydrogenase